MTASDVVLLSEDDHRIEETLKSLRLNEVSPAEHPSVRGERSFRGRTLGQGGIALLFHVCTKDATPAERRDVALLALLTGYDLRRAEVVVLDLFDHTAENGALLIRQGKGRKDWPVYLPARAQQHLRWRMSAQTVFAVLRARGAVADLAHFSPHDLLRTYISNLLDTGADLAIVQQLAGHADPAVTARYDRRREAAKQRTSQLLQILLASELGGGSA